VVFYGKCKRIRTAQTEIRATKVALGFIGTVRVRYKREKTESILNAQPDKRGELTNGRGDYTAKRFTGSSTPGAARNSACRDCRSRCG
jgi:hypothetical protein